MARPKKNEKDEIISLSYSFTESDRQYIIFKFKIFDLIFVSEFYEFRKEFSKKQIFLINEWCWIFREYADFLDAKHFQKKQSDYINNLPHPELFPIFRKLYSRFCIWFKYHKLIDPDSITNPVIEYYLIEFRMIIIGAFYYETLPDSKNKTLKFSSESRSVITGAKKESDTEVYKNGGGSPPDYIRNILFRLRQSNNTSRIRDLQIWERIERDCDRQMKRRPYNKYYKHLTLGDEIKLPKAGRKHTHQERCPNCSILMSIESHHDTYQQRTNYLKCPKCGQEKKVHVEK
jgi:hypothetical protein